MQQANLNIALHRLTNKQTPIDFTEAIELIERSSLAAVSAKVMGRTRSEELQESRNESDAFIPWVEANPENLKLTEDIFPTMEATEN
eukprot:SAG31_NODE_44654_length_262_cov_0.601227_1_plen_86_part_11